MNKIFRIGTRDSRLALFQAEKVQSLLLERGIKTELCLIKSEGDINLNTPLHGFSSIGVFTRALDEAMLAGEIDIAVHSNKDLPTTLTEGIIQAAVLKRDDPRDVLVVKGDRAFLEDQNSKAVIATGSVRRTAMWKSHFPHHEMVPLRGNVQTRLQKLEDHAWNGAIFGFAGLDRLNIRPEHLFFPEWMIPAPAQGVISVVCREEDETLFHLLRQLNHKETALLTGIEREFLKLMEGGCIAPIGAFATLEDGIVHLHTQVLDNNGNSSITVKKALESNHPDITQLAFHCYQEACGLGAQQLIASTKKDL